MTLRTLIVSIARGACLSAAIAAQPAGAEPDYRHFNEAPHDYFQRTPTDRFTRLRASLEAGQLPLDRGGDRAFILSLLEVLGVPASSQMLVFSTTSLQLSRISPSNPRALYFTDDVYVGYIPGGRIELVALDPDLGAVFYIFDIPKGTDPIQVERATRCMNCHAGDETGHVPGLVVKSVVPGPGGGSLDSFRRDQTGHGVALEERFGGWYLTGQGALTNHWGNTIGRFVEGVLTRIPNLPDERITLAKYPFTTSDLLPQLVHEHQVGFVNRVVEATYRARTHLHTDAGKLTEEHARDLDAQAAAVCRYLLFADETPLPAGGIAGDESFKADFLKTRRAVGEVALKDFDLRTRLFRHRCSYMIYSPVFAGLPPVMKERVFRRLGAALDDRKPSTEFAYLPVEEKRAIRAILRGTLQDLPKGW